MNKLLLQDLDKKLFFWFASRVDAKWVYCKFYKTFF